LGIVHGRGEFAVPDFGSRYVERLANCVEVESNYVWRNANGRNAAHARQASHCFAMMEKGRVVVSGGISELSDDMVHRHMAV